MQSLLCIDLENRGNKHEKNDWLFSVLCYSIACTRKKGGKFILYNSSALRTLRQNSKLVPSDTYTNTII
jgi:hypothetical protein